MWSYNRKRRRCLAGVMAFVFLLSFLWQIPVVNAEETELMAENSRMPDAEWKQGDYGSVGTLEGKTVIVSIFVKDKDSKWTKGAKKKVNKRLRAAASYLKKQAGRYGKKVELVVDAETHPELAFQAATTMKVKDSAKSQDKLYRKMVKVIDREVDVTSIREKYNTDSIGFVFHLNKSGVSSTKIHLLEEKGKDFYECSTLFSKFEGKAEESSTYAHELLHLFGARDLYMESLEDGITARFVNYVAKKHPNDIMYSTFALNGKRYPYKIKNEIGRVTAYFLGWKKTIPEKKKYPLNRSKKPGCFSEGTE